MFLPFRLRSRAFTKFSSSFVAFENVCLQFEDTPFELRKMHFTPSLQRVCCMDMAYAPVAKGVGYGRRYHSMYGAMKRIESF